MTPLVPIGIAIVANAAVLGGGLVWSKRQMRRAAAERIAAGRGLFVLEPLPPPGEEVQILIDDERGMLAELVAVHWPYLGWVDAATLLPVEDDVLGWRWLPSGERRRHDPAKMDARAERDSTSFGSAD